MVEILMPFALSAAKDLSPGRLIESLLLLFIIWRHLKPHLTKIEERIGGLETALKNGFTNGELRFQRIEERLENLEINKTHGG